MSTTAFAEAAPEISAFLTQNSNAAAVNFSRDVTRTPEGHVYVHTVSRRQLKSENGPFSRAVTFPGKGDGERYRTVMTLPNPFHFQDYDETKQSVVSESEDAKRVAMDMLNPSNLGVNQDVVVPEEMSLGDNTDLIRRGLFFTESLDPQVVDVAAAKAEERMRKHYERLVNRIREVERVSPQRLGDVLNDEGREAMDFFGIETAYNQSLKPKIVCPNCGDAIPAGVKFHKNSDMGFTCIIGQEGWKAAVAAGLKSKADVPEEFQRANPVGRPKQV